MDDYPSIDELWKQSVKDSLESEARRREWIEAEVYTAIQGLRIEHGAYLDIQVLVPWCGACVHFECRALETDMPAPDILAPAWKTYYRDLGISAKEMAHVARGIRSGWRPRCRQCGSDIDLAEGVYVRPIPLTSYFDLYVRSGRAPAWMKKAIREAFGNVCGECGGHATTLDHIVARSQGGLTEVVNLRPLCEDCNRKKADQDVELTEILLTFPLRPPPSDGFEGVIW